MDWNNKEKYNFGNQYFGEVKIVNFRNLYQLLKASYLHLKQQGHISSGAFFTLDITGVRINLMY